MNNPTRMVDKDTAYPSATIAGEILFALFIDIIAL